MSVRILVGSALERLKDMPDESVHTCITSPPYWGLRAYEGEKGMIGMEPSFAAHLDHLVAVFREVRRVLRHDGTFWLNYGDAYAGSGKGEGNETRKQSTNRGSYQRVQEHNKAYRAEGFKPKDLMMLSARVAIALQDDGWYLRQRNIWHKPNPMPSSATDRPTCAHEDVFLLARSRRYFYDHVAVRTTAKEEYTKMPDGWDTEPGAHGTVHRKGRSKGRKTDKQRGHSRLHAGFNDRWDAMSGKEQMAMGANLRHVWTIPVAGYSETHFATFPPALVEPCIKAGTSLHGVCSECGAPWEREINREVNGPLEAKPYAGDGQMKMSGYPSTNGLEGTSLAQTDKVTLETRGWRPTCACDAMIVPAKVLDPFAGAGTTGLVAQRLGRDAILIEISEKYANMAAKRLRQDAPLMADVEIG